MYINHKGTDKPFEKMYNYQLKKLWIKIILTIEMDYLKSMKMRVMYMMMNLNQLTFSFCFFCWSLWFFFISVSSSLSLLPISKASANSSTTSTNISYRISNCFSNPSFFYFFWVQLKL